MGSHIEEICLRGILRFCTCTLTHERGVMSLLACICSRFQNTDTFCPRDCRYPQWRGFGRVPEMSCRTSNTRRVLDGKFRRKCGRSGRWQSVVPAGSYMLHTQAGAPAATGPYSVSRQAPCPRVCKKRLCQHKHKLVPLYVVNSCGEVEV